MKKYCLFVVCLLVSALFLSGCQVDTGASMVKSQRRLEKYLPQPPSQTGRIDLSEGPKLKYDAKFGPKDLNFDIKIVNPY